MNVLKSLFRSLLPSARPDAPSPEPAIWGHLVKVSGKEPLSEFPLRGDSIELGRVSNTGEAIAFFQEDHSVSRLQGTIAKKGTQVFFENRSVNGTVVNGRLLTGSENAELMPGTLIEMGKYRAIVLYRPLGSMVTPPTVDAPKPAIPIHTMTPDHLLPEIDRNRTVQDTDRTVMDPIKRLPGADRTVLAPDKTAGSGEKTIRTPGKAAQESDRTVQITDRTVQAPSPGANEEP